MQTADGSTRFSIDVQLETEQLLRAGELLRALVAAGGASSATTHAARRETAPSPVAGGSASVLPAPRRAAAPAAAGGLAAGLAQTAALPVAAAPAVATSAAPVAVPLPVPLSLLPPVAPPAAALVSPAAAVVAHYPPAVVSVPVAVPPVATAAALAVPLSSVAPTPGFAVVPSAPSVAKAFHTSPLEHSNEPVNKVVFSPKFEGLLNDGTGWLISTSKHALLLWKCSSEPTPLELQHSLMLGERIVSMDVCDNTQMLAAAHHQHSVSLYSLQGDSFFAMKDKISRADITQVCSLQGLGGPLKTSLACAAGAGIVVYDLLNTQQPKASWIAHNDIISVLKRHPFALALLSGSRDGTVHQYDMRAKPSAPSFKFNGHQKAVTAIEVITENSVLTTSADATVLFWDKRKPDAPLSSVCPDGKSIVCLRANPARDAVAISTLKSLYLLSLSGNVLHPLYPVEERHICPDVMFDVNNGSLYAGRMDGSIAAFSREALKAATV